MADFATFLAAHDSVTGDKALESYRRQLDTIFDEALESDPVAVAVVEFMEHRAQWIGTSRQLLAELMAPLHNPPEWPTNARQLTNAMTRSAAMLRKIGITWQLGRKSKGGRVGTLTRVEPPTSPTSPFPTPRPATTQGPASQGAASLGATRKATS
jgi:DNA-binding NtrC family response regulator